MFIVNVERIVPADDGPSRHDYGLRRSAWTRGARIMGLIGADEALRRMDERADRSFERGDLATCLRWRELMAAVHAIESDVPVPGEQVH